MAKIRLKDFKLYYEELTTKIKRKKGKKKK